MSERRVSLLRIPNDKLILVRILKAGFVAQTSKLIFKIGLGLPVPPRSTSESKFTVFLQEVSYSRAQRNS